MTEINEGSSCVVNIDFLDENGDEVTPTSGKYRVDDAETGDAVIAWSPFTPSSSNQLLYISGANNRLPGTRREHKRTSRIVTIKYVYGVDSLVGTGEVRYAIKGLEYYESPSMSPSISSSVSASPSPSISPST